jgi:hypothetical protein
MHFVNQYTDQRIRYRNSESSKYRWHIYIYWCILDDGDVESLQSSKEDGLEGVCNDDTPSNLCRV